MITRGTNYYIKTTGPLGRELILTGSWTSDLVDVFRSHEIDFLWLNRARGWSDRNLDFLASVPELRGLHILARNLEDFSPVLALSHLERLTISTRDSFEVRLDFSHLPFLSVLSIGRVTDDNPLFNARNLKRLLITDYRAKSTDPFTRLPSLENLGFGNGPLASLTGLDRLQGLKSLRIFRFRSLRSLQGIEQLQNLEDLWIQFCGGIVDIDPIARLNRLRKLMFENMPRLSTIAPLAGLSGLEEVYLWGSTNVLDGNLEPIAKLPSLKSFGFQSRRHYSHRRKDFDRLPGIPTDSSIDSDTQEEIMSLFSFRQHEEET